MIDTDGRRRADADHRPIAHADAARVAEVQFAGALAIVVRHAHAEQAGVEVARAAVIRDVIVDVIQIHRAE
jgi:hypothetical protein